MIKLIDRALDLIMDYVFPLFVIVYIIGGIIIIPMAIYETMQSQKDAEVESCILEHKEEDPYCRLLILKYQSRQCRR